MNQKTFNAIVLFLGIALLLCVGGVVALSVAGKPVDDILKQAITGIVTGLLGLMVRAPDNKDESQAVHLSEEPLPVVVKEEAVPVVVKEEADHVDAPVLSRRTRRKQ